MRLGHGARRATVVLGVDTFVLRRPSIIVRLPRFSSMSSSVCHTIIPHAAPLGIRLVRGYHPTINSRIKVRIQSLGTALKARKPKLLELDWSNLRAESVSKRERWWINTIWTLANKILPSLPAALAQSSSAALAQSSSAGLVPLLSPLQ
ncbi:hypothetical protein PCANC_19760 [Puccinia coronata f. sp. avenae]|uniref:Uncharacterized protein n=1 Tax=Puccinia coronata f. sp. avenae TaxID=200324 RepID=A0A2N5UB97_9BASI|nr:hypothetical protein PCANC_19760 [Puccinia coronata f. sp. avenae]